MRKFPVILLIVVLLAAVVSTRATGDTADDYFVSVLQSIADYSLPGVGVEENTYLPKDHIRLEPKSGLTYGDGLYTAASKIAPYLLFLLKVHEAEGYYSRISMPATVKELEALERFDAPANNQTISLLRMYRMLNTIRALIDEEKKEAPHISGMVPWLSIGRDGKVSRDKDLVPLLDNGLLSWAFAATLMGLQSDDFTLAGDVRDMLRELMARQKYENFIDQEAGLFFGEIDAVTGMGNPGYMLKRIWTEDMLSVLWGLLTSPIPEEERLRIWDHQIAPVVTWETLDGETIDVPRGYIASNHELIWTLCYLPVKDLPLYPFFYNSQYAQADFAVREQNPGFQGVAYDALGTYMKMGIPALAEFPEYVQKHDGVPVFVTAAAAIVEPRDGKQWIYNVISRYSLLTRLGPLESVGPEGKADILSADSQYLIALALGGGVGDEITAYLHTHRLVDSDETMLEATRRLLDRKQRQILSAEGLEAVRRPQHPFPLPPEREYPTSGRLYGLQSATYEILDNLAESSDDRHGANVFSPRGRHMRWEILDDGMLVRHKIPKNAGRHARFAWWGTYLGRNRPYLAGYTDVDITIPNDGMPHKFNLLLRREDTTLVKPILLDTRAEQGVVSEDGKWKTYRFPLKHRRRFLRLPLTYVAFSVKDPVRNEGYLFEDTVQVKSVRLVHTGTSAQRVDVRAAIDAIGPLPPFAARPPRPPVMKGGVEPTFFSSGAIGEATEDITREKDGHLYFEFEDVDTEKGYSGIWAQLREIYLPDYNYLVFDILKGAVGDVPNLLRVECRYEDETSERIECAWNVNLAESGIDISRDEWSRVILPLPLEVAGRRFNVLSFYCENWVGKQSMGSIDISSPVFAKSIRQTRTEEPDRIIRLSPELRPGDILSLMPYWQIQKMDTSFHGKADVNVAERTVMLVSRGGWAGSKLYPSMLPAALGDTVILSIMPQSEEEECSGMLEFKSGRMTIATTPAFTVPAGAGFREVELPINYRTTTAQADYIAVASIRGEYTIQDMRVTKKPADK